MLHPNFKYLRAIGALIGSTVGAGVLGLPYAFAQSGAAIGALWLFLLAGVMLALYLMFAEVALHTPGNKHRIGGYAQRHMGEGWGLFASALMTFTLIGITTAHVIVGSGFIFDVFHPFFGGSQILYAVLMAMVAAAITWRGTKATLRVEGVVVGILLFLFLFATLASLPHITWENIAMTHVDGWLLPYGVILFSLFGLNSVPEMKDVLGAQSQRLPHAITKAFFIVVTLYLLFAICTVGVTGTHTTQMAFSGLATVLGGSFGAISSVLGSITLLSIFVMSSLQLQNLLRFDLHVPRVLAWLMASSFAPILYIVGIRQFIGLIGFVGSVFAAAVGIIIVLMYEKMRHSGVCKEPRCLNVPSWISFTIVILLFVGIVSEFVQVLA